VYEPVYIRPLGVMAKYGIQYLLFDVRRPVGLGKINKVRGEFGDGLVLAKTFQQGDMFLEIDKVQEPVVYLPRIIPDIHGEYQSHFEHKEEKPFDDLDGIRHKEGGFHHNKYDEDGNNRPEGIMLDIPQEVIDQYRGHQHGDGDGKSVCGRHGFGCPEIEDYQETACA
jgi:hypothetical protein